MLIRGYQIGLRFLALTAVALIALGAFGWWWMSQDVEKQAPPPLAGASLIEQGGIVLVQQVCPKKITCRPVPGANAHLGFYRIRGGRSAEKASAEVRAALDGTFRVRLAPLPYNVKVTLPGRAPVVIPATVGQGPLRIAVVLG